MANQARILIGLLLASSGVAGSEACSRRAPDDKVEQRRELLKPSDSRQRELVLEQKRELVDPKGALLASDEAVGGLVLPRGLRQVVANERRWAYRSTRIAFGALDSYFGERLFTGQLERGLTGSVTFVAAQVKAAPKEPRITLRIARLNGADDDCEITIEQEPPRPPTLSAEEADALTRKEQQSRR